MFNTSYKMRAENAKQYHIMAHHIISYHMISYHVISYHVMSCHVISYHIISYIMSYHIISYTSFAYHGEWERFFTGSVYFAFLVILSIRFYTNTTRTHVAVSFNRWKANLSQSSFSTFKLKFNGYFKTRIAKYLNSSSYFQLSGLQLSGNISPNPRPDEETRQSTDHLCFSLKEKKVWNCAI